MPREGQEAANLTQVQQTNSWGGDCGLPHPDLAAQLLHWLFFVHTSHFIVFLRITPILLCIVSKSQDPRISRIFILHRKYSIFPISRKLL